MSAVRFGGRRLRRVVMVAAVATLAGAGLVAPAQAIPQPGSAADTEPVAVATGSLALSGAGKLSTRGDSASGRGVLVRDVTVSGDARVVSARVFWNQEMIARKGHRDRFNVRLVVFGAGGAADPIVLGQRSRRSVPPTVQNVRIKLGTSEAAALRASSDVVLAVSQQYGRRGQHHNKFYRQYATVTHVGQGLKSRTSARSASVPTTRAGRDCRRIEIRPGADLSGCDLSRANLSVCDLTGVNLTGAVLSGALLRGCDVSGTKLAGANVTGAVTGGIVGTPASLPDGWTLVNGTLTPTGDGTGGGGSGSPPVTAFAVTYDGNGSTGGAAPTDGSSPYAAGVTVTVLGNTGSLVKAGSTFAGWNTAANGSGTAYAAATTFTMGSAAVTLYAQWTVLPNMTVIFNANGGVGADYTQVANVATNLTANTFTRAGFSFAGWATTAGGTVVYADGAPYPFTATETLYAQWTALPNMTVIFDNNTGTGTMADQVANVATNLSTNTFTKAGFSFSGWATTAGGPVVYADGASYPFTADATLYAQWTPIPTFAVTYDGNGNSGGSVPVDGSSPYAAGASVTVLGNTGSLVNTGFTFAGWFNAASGGTAYGTTFTMPANAVTVYAQWGKTVTFNSNTGTGTMANQAANVATALTTNTFTKTGYSFMGWNTAVNGLGTPYANGASYLFTADATLYAQWSPTAGPSCSSFSVGDTGPGGGIIFYKDTAQSVGGQCFEAAPTSWSPLWGGQDPPLIWGVGSQSGQCGNLDIPAAVGTTIGSGTTNTTAITTTVACDTPAEAPAPWAAKNYNGGGLLDWFLPSKDELNQLCKYARGQTTAVGDQTTVCNNTGTLPTGLSLAMYRSSSVSPSIFYRALVQHFGNGNQVVTEKKIGERVRPVRAF